MSDDQTSEDHLHSSPQIGGEGPGLHPGRSNLMKGLDGVKATTKISDMTSEQQDLLLQNQRQMEGFHPRVESDGSVDKEVAQGKKQFEEKKGEPKKEAPQPGPPSKEPAMTEVKNSSGDPHTDEKLSVYKNLFL